MSDDRTVPFIDGHNDVLAKALKERDFDFVTGAKKGHLDLPGALEAGMAGGLFAVFISSTPGPVPLARARRAVLSMFSLLRRYIDASRGRMVQARSSSELTQAVESHRTGSPGRDAAGPVLAAVFHMEGAEAIDGRLEALDMYFEAGLRSLGPVWSRSNRFATGVPFSFNRDPDIGPGLTKAGRELVRRCNELGILIDVSHLNAAGFWDVARLSKAPLVASHSNAWTLCKSTRNLTDEQLAAIRDTRGLVGVNFGVPFLRSDGARTEDTPLSLIGDHVEYLAERLGIDSVAFGSDFDGVLIPKELGDVSGVPALIRHLRSRGWNHEEIEKIAHGNWIRLFRETVA